jgi:predicted PurR-regulated permease PerM
MFPDPATPAGTARLFRTAAITFIAATVIVALYFGREVLIPAALAVLFSFILAPLVSLLRRLLPLPLAVAAVVLGALLVGGTIAALFTTQLAEVAGSLAGYQANLQQKIHDIRALAENGGALSRFVAMLATLGDELSLGAGAAAERPVRLQEGASNFTSVVLFAAPLLHPILAVGIVVILVVFILLDRDHLGDQLVRLFGASDVHATSEAIGDAASRVARALTLQLLTNFGFAIVVGGGLFALGLPNPVLWGLLAGGLRFVPYAGAILAAVLPTLIAFAVMPGWGHPFLVLAWIIGCDLIIGQIIEPLLFGESTGVTPLALIMSAIFWATLWGPIGLLLSTPLTICLRVVGSHVAHLGFLQILLGDEPALTPSRQIYRRLIAEAVADAATVAVEVIEEQGWAPGLDDAMGRMLVLAESDRLQDRLSDAQVEAIVDGTSEVLDVVADSVADGSIPPPPPADVSAREAHATFRCVGGRGQIDDAAAALVAFALRQAGLEASSHRYGERIAGAGEQAAIVHLLCYASHPSDTVRRYAMRKLTVAGGIGQARHLVIDYDVAPAPAPSIPGIAGPSDTFAGDVASLCRLAAQHVALLGRRPGLE